MPIKFLVLGYFVLEGGAKFIFMGVGVFLINCNRYRFCSSGASRGSLHGGTSFKVEKAHFAAQKEGPENRKYEEIRNCHPLCAVPWSTLWFAITSDCLENNNLSWLEWPHLQILAVKNMLFLQIWCGEKLLEKCRWTIFKRPERGFKMFGHVSDRFSDLFFLFFGGNFVLQAYSPNRWGGGRKSSMPFFGGWEDVLHTAPSETSFVRTRRIGASPEKSDLVNLWGPD